jgi:pyrroloquinoline quinone biosynthesis protein D
MVNRLSMDANINIADGVRLQWEHSQAGYVLLFPEGIVTLNNSAADILKLCDGHHAITAIIAELQSKYTTGDLTDLTKDIYAFLTEALQKTWIVVM